MTATRRPSIRRRLALAAVAASAALLTAVAAPAHAAPAAPAAEASTAALANLQAAAFPVGVSTLAADSEIVWHTGWQAAPDTTSATVGTIGYTIVLRAFYSTLPPNYVPLRLVKETKSTWKHMYRIQFGTTTGQANSEQIQWVGEQEAYSNHKFMGAFFSQSFVNSTGGATTPLGSGYSPYIPTSQPGYALVQIKNVHGQTIEKWFPTDGTGSGTGGNW
jgi:hypothetical protein